MGDTVLFCFNLHLPDDYWYWEFFNIHIGHLFIFFWETFIQVLWPLFNWIIYEIVGKQIFVCFAFCFSIVWVPYIFWIHTLSGLQTFSLIHVFHFPSCLFCCVGALQFYIILLFWFYFCCSCSCVIFKIILPKQYRGFHRECFIASCHNN